MFKGSDDRCRGLRIERAGRFISKNNSGLVINYPGYRNTLYYTILGTAINLVMTVLAAYPLSRKDWVGRGFFMAVVMFTMLGSGLSGSSFSGAGGAFLVLGLEKLCAEGGGLVWKEDVDAFFW